MIFLPFQAGFKDNGVFSPGFTKHSEQNPGETIDVSD